MAITEDGGIQNWRNENEEGLREPLVVVDEGGNPWMIYFCTSVAVCGSYEFGACVGYSSPTQSAIREDLKLSLSGYSVFGPMGKGHDTHCHFLFDGQHFSYSKNIW